MSVQESRPIQIFEPFDEAQAKMQMEKGNNTIKGEAFLKQNGGTVVTCAGNSVMLLPATSYAKSRIVALYGPDDREGVTRVNFNKFFKFTPDIPEYTQLQHRKVCNSRGEFEFRDVANGTYYVMTAVSWAAPQYNWVLETTVMRNQGGALLQKVMVQGGETKELILTQ